MYSEGALNYTATALSPSGHVSTCSSNITNCELPELQCGQLYNLTVVASDGKCSSPPSSSLQLDSGELSPYNATSCGRNDPVILRARVASIVIQRNESSTSTCISLLTDAEYLIHTTYKHTFKNIVIYIEIQLVSVLWYQQVRVEYLFI